MIEAKTLEQIYRVCEDCTENEIDSCDKCDFNNSSWVRLEDHQQEIEAYGRTNEALAKVCSNLNERIGRLQRELRTISQWINQAKPFSNRNLMEQILRKIEGVLKDVDL